MGYRAVSPVRRLYTSFRTDDFLHTLGHFSRPVSPGTYCAKAAVLLVVMWSAAGNLAPGGRHGPGSCKGEGEWTIWTGCKTKQGYIHKRSGAYPTGAGSCCFSCCTREMVTSAWTTSPRGSAGFGFGPAPPER